jgi:hypothetical protein
MKVSQHLPSLLVLLSLPSALSFSARIPPDHTISNDDKPNPRTAKMSFHQVLERVGKTVFRPGGSAATAVMQDWAEVGPADTVLELCAGLGTGGMALAERRGCHVLLTDIDEERLTKAMERAEQNGMSGLIKTRRMDLLRDSLPDREHFQAAMVEASLTHFPDVQREKILLGLKDHTDQLLLHEMCLRGTAENDDVSKRAGKALGIGFHPLTDEGWRDLLDRSGFEITHLEAGPLAVLNPKNLLQDEGPLGLAKIAWNLATKPDLRERVVSTRKVLGNDLGYVILRAVPKTGN